MKYVHIINDLRKLTGKKVDLVEEGQLKPFAVRSAEMDKILIYERKAQG
jgi:predicted nucleotidyltransferase